MPKIISTAGFNPRPSCEGRPEETKKELEAESFNPRPSCEGRPSESRQFPLTSCFNPRPSCEGRLCPLSLGTVFLLFQSTPLLRGATACGGTGWLFRIVSIHAPLARGDGVATNQLSTSCGFNPRPSCEGRLECTLYLQYLLSFNPRPSCEGRLRQRPGSAEDPAVSIHAPLARGDADSLRNLSAHCVSIHAPLARGDLRTATCSHLRLCFNPRPSCEGRHWRSLTK